MARTAARLTDCISLGAVDTAFPRPLIERVLARTGKARARPRDLPAPVVVYDVVALALFMQASYREVLRVLPEGVQWLSDQDSEPVGSSRARWNPRAIKRKMSNWPTRSRSRSGTHKVVLEIGIVAVTHE